LARSTTGVRDSTRSTTGGMKTGIGTESLTIRPVFSAAAAIYPVWARHAEPPAAIEPVELTLVS